MTVALLCPTRGRPELLKRMWESAKRTASGKLHLHIGVIDEDRHAYAAITAHDANVTFYGVKDWSTCFTWNLLAEEALKSDASLFMLAADDTIFTTPHWDKALMEHYDALTNKIHAYHLLDSRDPDGAPHPIVTREYIQAMGYFLPPIFLHWYVDSWTVQIAKTNNCFTHFRDYMLVHEKPSDAGQADETHNRIRDMGWRERDKWVNDKLKLTYFGMECQRLKWALEQ